MELADEVLRERHFLDERLFLHHFEADIAGFHIFQVLHFSFSDDLAEKEQKLGLAICQGVALNVVAVEVEIHGELAVKAFPIPLGEWQDGAPSFNGFCYVEVLHGPKCLLIGGKDTTFCHDFKTASP